MFNIVDGKLVEMVEKEYDSEAVLQELLADFPTLMVGNQINPTAPRRWLLVKREIGIPDAPDASDRWALDHLFLDQDGIPTLVEVKRSTDTRIRREVVGQLLDYASNAVVHWPLEKLKTDYKNTCLMRAIDHSEHLSAFLHDGLEQEDYWQKVKTNLQAGKVRLLFIADVIPSELQRIIEFLNEQMDPAEVLGIEIKQFIGNDKSNPLTSLVPRVIGQTAVAEKRKGAVREKRNWNQDLFLLDLAKRRGANQANTAKKTLDWAMTKSVRLWWGSGKQDGSVYFLVDQNEETRYLFAIWSSGKIEFPFPSMARSLPFADAKMRIQLLDRINTIQGVALNKESIEKYPRIDLETICSPNSFSQFIEIAEWAIEQINEASK